MRLLVLGFLLMSAGIATAQDGNNLEVTTVVQKQVVTTNDSGESEKRLIDATAVAPGETVFYTITFRNVGAEKADNVVITNPISNSLSYVDGSAFGPGASIEFSVDGGLSFGDASELVVGEGDEARSAQPSDFTHVRWVLNNDLAVGAQGIARFAAVLE